MLASHTADTGFRRSGSPEQGKILATLVARLMMNSPLSEQLLPYLYRWHQLYAIHGLTLHLTLAPRFDFERTTGYYLKHPALLDAPWEITVDQSGHDQLWPNIDVVGTNGIVLEQSIGLTACTQLEDSLRAALHHAGAKQLPPVTRSHHHVHAFGTYCFPAQPETLVGKQVCRYKNAPTELNHEYFVDPLDSSAFGLGLQGHWKLTNERIESSNATQSEDYLSYVFAGFELYAVLAPTGKGPTVVTLSLNGQALRDEQLGADIVTTETGAQLIVNAPRLYHLVRSSEYLAPAELRLFRTEGDVGVYLFSASGCRAI